MGSRPNIVYKVPLLTRFKRFIIITEKTKRGRPAKERKEQKPTAYDYDSKIGEDLIHMAEIMGDPLHLLRANHKLFGDQIEAWLGQSGNKIYFQQNFFDSYKEYQSRREHFFSQLAMSGKISRDVWRCIAWTQLHSKIEPPREVQSSADVKTTLQVEDLHEIIKNLDKNAHKDEGFC